MNIKNILLTSVILISSIAAPSAVLAAGGQWDGTPEKIRFTFNDHIGSSFIKQVEVKTGERTTDYGYTEIKLDYNPGECSGAYYTDYYFTVELWDDWGNYEVVNTDASYWFSPDSDTRYMSIGYKFYPTDATVTVNEECNAR